MHAIYQLLAVVAAATLTSTRMVRTSSDEEKNFELLILHNNDMHARFEQTSQQLGTCTPDDREKGKCYGGFARVAHVVKEARLAAATGTGPPVLYLNAGDTYTGSAWFTLYKWKIAAEFINAIQPDAMSLGNHEFSQGVDGLAPYVATVTSPILAANIDITRVPQLAHQRNIKPYAVFDISGFRVAVIGYITPNTKRMGIPDVDFFDEIETLNNQIRNLKKRGVKIFIALGHSGYLKDLEIAEKVDVDLVVGGHSHTFLRSGDDTRTFNETDKVIGPYPSNIKQLSGKIVPVVTAYYHTKYLGKILLRFNSNGEIVKTEGQPILLDKTVPEDLAVLSLVREYRIKVHEFEGEVIGKTAVHLDSQDCVMQECPLGNLVTDSMLYYYALNYKGDKWTDVSVAIINSKAMRTSIPAGQSEITRGQLLTMLPFNDDVYRINVTGDVLLRILEHTVKSYGTRTTPDILQVSGLKVVYNVTKAPGFRLVDVRVRCWTCDETHGPAYNQLEIDESYGLLTVRYLQAGGNDYSMIPPLPARKLDFTDITSVEHYIRHRAKIFPQIEDRIKILTNTTLET